MHNAISGGKKLQLVKIRCLELNSALGQRSRIKIRIVMTKSELSDKIKTAIGF